MDGAVHIPSYFDHIYFLEGDHWRGKVDGLTLVYGYCFGCQRAGLQGLSSFVYVDVILLDVVYAPNCSAEFKDFYTNL